MTYAGSRDGSECQFGFQTARCVFVDGHPGAHVCVGAQSARVFIRGPGEIPEATYLWDSDPTPGRTPPRRTGAAPTVSPELFGGWSRSMIRRLLDEIHEAGVASPADWTANFRRLRGKGVPG
jgi:hypothetical protein